MSSHNLYVQKFGGTSLATPERIQKVAEIIQNTLKNGHQVAVVVSAMGHETDRLVNLAKQISPSASGREYASLISTGEQVSATLLSLCLSSLGLRAKSFTGGQAGILTDSQFEKARILHIDESALQQALEDGYIPIITGFQGVNEEGDITTLGRGGSDTTAVALAVALKAQECQIFTDVDGVYTTDPRICSQAQFLPEISGMEMLESSSLGNQVLHVRSVEMAEKYHMPLRVLSSFQKGLGTCIKPSANFHAPSMEKAAIRQITYSREEVLVTLSLDKNKLYLFDKYLHQLGLQMIEVDMLTYSPECELVQVNISQSNAIKALQCFNNIIQDKNMTCHYEQNLSKISLIGVGLMSHPGVLQKMLFVLSEQKIVVKLLLTSEMKISVLIPDEKLKRGICALHEAFLGEVLDLV